MERAQKLQKIETFKRSLSHLSTSALYIWNIEGVAVRWRHWSEDCTDSQIWISRSFQSLWRLENHHPSQLWSYWVLYKGFMKKKVQCISSSTPLWQSFHAHQTNHGIDFTAMIGVVCGNTLSNEVARKLQLVYVAFAECGAAMCYAKKKVGCVCWL